MTSYLAPFRSYRSLGLLFKFWTLCVFDPPSGVLETTYDVHLRLIGKCVDFVLVLIKLFSLGVTAEMLQANIGWKSSISPQRGPVDPKFHVAGVAPTNHSSSKKTRLNGLSYGIKNLDRSFFCFVTIYAFDRRTERRTDKRTDRRTALSSLYRVCIPCSAVIKRE